MPNRLFATIATIALAAATAHAQNATAPIAPADAGDEIVLTGQRAQQEPSIAAKRLAIGILDVLAGNRNWPIQNERYGRTYYLGLSMKL